MIIEGCAGEGGDLWAPLTSPVAVTVLTVVFRCDRGGGSGDRCEVGGLIRGGSNAGVASSRDIIV